jgi:hypothetical protein
VGVSEVFDMRAPGGLDALLDAFLSLGRPLLFLKGYCATYEMDATEMSKYHAPRGINIPLEPFLFALHKLYFININP